jgi:hypothetical protein
LASEYRLLELTPKCLSLLKGGRGDFFSSIELPPLLSLFNIENLVLRARSKFDGFAGKDCEVSWSTGILEYWSVGKS